MPNLKLLTAGAVALALAVIFTSSQAASVAQLDQLKDQFLPKEFRNRNFTVDEMKAVFREKCKKSSGSDNETLYAEVEKGVATMMQCLSGLANITAIQEEIETARPIGELDSVFHKYCTKMPEAQRCLREFNAKLQPCLSEAERLQNAVMVRVATNLMGFMCAKGGDQIALFVAEDGPECLEANKEAIGHCLNSSFAQYLPKDAAMPDLYNLPELVLAPEHCIDLHRFEACTLHHLGQCQEITPLNVAESVFKFIKNETACASQLASKDNERSVLKPQSRSGAARETASRLAVPLLVGLLAIIRL